MSLLPEDLTARRLAFRAAREWEQFHRPQNLAIAIAVEAGELLEQFQWMRPGETRPTEVSREAVELEVADLLILLTYLCHDLGIDAASIAERKLAINTARYPLAKAKGSATKYDQFD